MAGRSVSGKLAQEAQITIEEQPQVVHAITQHGEAIKAHTKCEALILCRVDVDIAQDLRMHHAATANLEPPVLERHVDFCRRLGKREVRRPEAHLQVFDFEEVAQKFTHHTLQVGKGCRFVYPQTFELVKHRRVGLRPSQPGTLVPAI